MAIRLAFSTVACPQWPLSEVVRRAAEYGYQGVELRTLGAGSSGLASDPMLSETAKVADVFRGKGVEPVCLSTSISLHHRGLGELHRAKHDTLKAIDAAKAMGCPAVRVFGYEVSPGENRKSVLQRIAERARELADHAGEAGVQLLFENAGSLKVAKEWWWLLNLVEHPMVGLLWNVANSASADAADRGGWVSVPTLNSRIRLAKVKDAKIGEASGYLPLGEGNVGVRDFLHRLRGVGYDGYVSVEWDRLWLGDALAPAEQFLPGAAQTLKGWLDEIDQRIAGARADREKLAEKERKAIEKAMAAARDKRQGASPAKPSASPA